MALASLLLALLISAQGQALREVQVATLGIFSGSHQVLVLVELQPALRNFFSQCPSLHQQIVRDFPGG